MLFHFPTLWCWIPWTARRPNQSILKEISPEYSLEGLMLKLKLQYFGHLMWRADSLEKTLYWERLRAGGEGDYRGWNGWMASLTWWTWVWASSGNWWWTGGPGVLQSLGSQRVGHDWATEQQQPNSALNFSPTHLPLTLTLKRENQPRGHLWRCLKCLQSTHPMANKSLSWPGSSGPILLSCFLFHPPSLCI